MLYLIGLGLSEPEDITVKGLEIVKKAKRVYLEAYTSILMAASNTSLEDYYGRPIIIADREMVEQESDAILENGQTEDIAFLVVGDPFGATTHTDLVLRARELGIKYQVIHNASVMNAVGACGLQLYTFGQCVSIVFFTDNWRPDSFYHKIQENRRLGLHTLLLLDIKVKEQTLENIARGRKIYEPPRYMNIDTCAQQLLEVQEKLGEKNYDSKTPCIAVSRLGSPNQEFKAGTLEEMAEYDAGEPLHSLILMGHRIHDLERDFFIDWAINKDKLLEGLAHDQEMWKQ